MYDNCKSRQMLFEWCENGIFSKQARFPTCTLNSLTSLAKSVPRITTFPFLVLLFSHRESLLVELCPTIVLDKISRQGFFLERKGSHGCLSIHDCQDIILWVGWDREICFLSCEKQRRAGSCSATTQLLVSSVEIAGGIIDAISIVTPFFTS